MSQTSSDKSWSFRWTTRDATCNSTIESTGPESNSELEVRTRVAHEKLCWAREKFWRSIDEIRWTSKSFAELEKSLLEVESDLDNFFGRLKLFRWVSNRTPKLFSQRGGPPKHDFEEGGTPKKTWFLDPPMGGYPTPLGGVSHPPRGGCPKTQKNAKKHGFASLSKTLCLES